MRIRGTAAALITPFTEKKLNEVDYEIDWPGLRKNVEFQNKHADFIVANGTTGESATLSKVEHEKVAKVVMDSAKIPVVAGTGSNCTREALHYTRHAADIGCDAALVVYPYYNRPPYDKAKLHYFGLLAGKVDIPIIMYLVPSRTGKNTEMPVDDVVELATQYSNIVGIKEATGKPDRAREIMKKVARTDFVVFSGDDGMNCDICLKGGRGAISVLANVLPGLVSEGVRLAAECKLEDAKDIQDLINPFCNAVFLETNPIGIKDAMNALSMPAGPLRPPLGSMRPENSSMVKKELKELERNGYLKRALEFYGKV
jgi:4-hydroxy-tetrahydrodipicolinate synthase